MKVQLSWLLYEKIQNNFIANFTNICACLKITLKSRCMKLTGSWKTLIPAINYQFLALIPLSTNWTLKIGSITVISAFHDLAKFKRHNKSY